MPASSGCLPIMVDFCDGVWCDSVDVWLLLFNHSHVSLKLNWPGGKKSASTPCYLNSNWICNPASVGRDLYVLMFCFSTYEKLFKSETLKQYIDTESDQRLHTSCIYAFKRQQKTAKVFSPRHTHPSNHLHLGAIFFVTNPSYFWEVGSKLETRRHKATQTGNIWTSAQTVTRPQDRKSDPEAMRWQCYPLEICIQPGIPWDSTKKAAGVGGFFFNVVR